MPVDQQTIIAVIGNVVQCRGAWTLSNLNDLERRIERLGWPTASEVICDVGEVTAMDTGGALLLQRIESDLVRRGKAVSVRGLKPEFAELVRMVRAKARLNHASPAQQAGWEKSPLVSSVKIGTDGVIRALAFLGETTVAIGRSLLRPGLIRWKAVLRVMELDGVRALPITGLLTFLVGVVIAYQGAEQLR
ncbi:MAG: STAS domain-containing protein, partial [Nitrospira sp.]|nr:STAS domain-containing protein [Nitrospira sp.]